MDAESKPDVKGPNTWADVFDEVWSERANPGITWSEDEVDFILWNFTSFPFGTEDDVREQLGIFFEANAMGPKPPDLAKAAETFFDEQMGERRYECASCGAQFAGPRTDIEPGKFIYCEPCYQNLISDGLIEDEGAP